MTPLKIQVNRIETSISQLNGKIDALLVNTAVTQTRVDVSEKDLKEHKTNKCSNLDRHYSEDHKGHALKTIILIGSVVTAIIVIAKFLTLIGLSELTRRLFL